MATSIDLAVDTSALTAILLGEPDAAVLLRAPTAAPRTGLCAPNRTELLVVIQARLGDLGVERAKQFLALEQVRTIPLDETFLVTKLQLRDLQSSKLCFARLTQP